MFTRIRNYCTTVHLLTSALVVPQIHNHIVCQYLKYPQEATAIVHTNKKLLLERDFTLLFSHATVFPSLNFAKIAKFVSWRKIWDGALDYAYRGTICVQAILREFSRPTFGDRICHLRNNRVEDYFLLHLCNAHPSLVRQESLTTIIDKLSAVDMPFIITLGSNLCHSIESPSFFLLFFFHFSCMHHCTPFGSPAMKHLNL